MLISSACRTLAIALILLVGPGAGQAGAAQAVPDEMVDPVGAMEPEIEVSEPAAQPRPQAQAAAPAPTVAAIDEPPARPAQATAGVAAAPDPTAPIGSGALPFTGPEPGLLVLLFLVGSVALCGGAVAFAHARAISEAA